MTLSKGRCFFAAACVMASALAEKMEFLAATHQNYFSEDYVNMVKSMSANMFKESA